jgi:hypothetical protein
MMKRKVRSGNQGLGGNQIMKSGVKRIEERRKDIIRQQDK